MNFQDTFLKGLLAGLSKMNKLLDRMNKLLLTPLYEVHWVSSYYGFSEECREKYDDEVYTGACN